MRLGIYGGAFDPIHAGHLAVARAVRDAHRLDRVFLVPSGRPPHKRCHAGAADRLAMVRLAVAGEQRIEASGEEVERSGTSYTVDTLEGFRRRIPGVELFFIVGADSVPEMRTWRSLRRIFELARVVAVNRPGHAASFAPELFEDVPPALLERARADAVEMPPSAASSTEVRERVARGEDVGDLVPPAVAGYIAERGLYRSEPGADASGR